MTSPIEDELVRLLGNESVIPTSGRREYLHDSTEMQGLAGAADAVVCPSSVDEVASLVTWCYANGVAMVPRGGGTGFAGGAVPIGGGVVCSLERLDRIRRFEPDYWRMEVEAGVTTARIHEMSRHVGLLFPPDPGASEQSHIGGNIACNAGGPHSFKYGVTGAWVSGIEAVIAPGNVVHFGGPVRKDAAGYNLASLLVGAEGTLGIITGAWLKLTPAPEARIPVIGVYPSLDAGAAAVFRIFESGLLPATLEYLDAGTLRLARGSFPGSIPDSAAFLVLSEADGSVPTARAMQADLQEVLGAGALLVRSFEDAAAQRELWRWRSGVSYAVSARRGGKMSEDVAVPIEMFPAVIRELEEIGSKVGLPVCSWGHAGDGNLHATFVIDASNPDDIARAQEGTSLLFQFVLDKQGTVSGEHGLGWVKREQFGRQFGREERALHEAVKRVFDPKNLFNPGKKIPTPQW